MSGVSGMLTEELGSVLACCENLNKLNIDGTVKNYHRVAEKNFFTQVSMTWTEIWWKDTNRDTHMSNSFIGNDKLFDF